MSSAGHGERAGDAVRAGVRREEVPHDGRVHAAVVDRAVHVRGAANHDHHQQSLLSQTK